MGRQQGDPERWKLYWQDDESRLIHFIGKDNIVFHTLMFPGHAEAYGKYVVPDQVPANEFLNIEGSKLSTSRGWAVWLHEYLEDFPPTLLRYVLASTLPESKDSAFSWREFQTRVNSELADILGNFVNRALTFAKREFDNCVPPLVDPSTTDTEVIEQLSLFPERLRPPTSDSGFARRYIRHGRRAIGQQYFNDQAHGLRGRRIYAVCQYRSCIAADLRGFVGVDGAGFAVFGCNARNMLRLEGVRLACQEAVTWEVSLGGSGLLFTFNWSCLGRKDILFSKVSDTAIQRQIENWNLRMHRKGRRMPRQSLRSAMMILQSWTSEWTHTEC